VIPKKKRRLRTALRYVEDYIEELLSVLEREEKEEVEVKIEEEKVESLKIRIMTKAPDGRKTEVTCEAPRLLPKEFPSIALINTRSPSGLVQQQLSITKELETYVHLPSIFKISYHLQLQSLALCVGVKKIEPLSLPYIGQVFHSWLRDNIKVVGLYKQPGIKAFSLKQLLRLVEVSPILPSISEVVKCEVRIPTLMYERLLIQHEINAKLRGSAEELQATVQAQRLRSIGMLDLLFLEEKEKFRKFVGASAEYAGEPVIIILPEHEHHLWYLFWVVCRELYREARGAYPEPVVLLEKGHDVWLRHVGGFSGKIVILHEKFVRSDEDKEFFRKRLQEMFSQGLGFLIIIAKEVFEAEKFVRELCKPFQARIIGVYAIPRLGIISRHTAKLLSAAFGVPFDEICETEGLDVKEKIITIFDDKPIEFPNLDIMVARIDRAYREFVNKLLSSDYVAYSRRDVGEQESEDHVAMKILVIKLLHEAYGVGLQKIFCTYKVGDEVIADIYVRDKELAIECETMLGTAPAPLLKIFESVRKYIERELTEHINEIWVVIRNWPAIVHLGDLFWAENILRKELKQFNKKVKFFVPDIRRESLRAMDDIVRELET
jgi:hypothetical protein